MRRGDAQRATRGRVSDRAFRGGEREADIAISQRPRRALGRADDA